MNCREFTAEFEERRNVLSKTAQLHLNDCPGCKKTSGKQTRVWQMIDGLKELTRRTILIFASEQKSRAQNLLIFKRVFCPHCVTFCRSVWSLSFSVCWLSICLSFPVITRRRLPAQAFRKRLKERLRRLILSPAIKLPLQIK